MARGIRVAAARNGVEAQVEVVEAVVGAEVGEVMFLESADPLTSGVWDRGVKALEGRLRRLPQWTLDEWVLSGGAPRVDFTSRSTPRAATSTYLRELERRYPRFCPAMAVTTHHHPSHCEQMRIALLTGLEANYRTARKRDDRVRSPATPRSSFVPWPKASCDADRSESPVPFCRAS